jgi:hypothetical protein
MFKGIACVGVCVCIAFLGTSPGQAEDPETLAFVSGGATGTLYRIDTTGPVEIFSAHGGFRPEGIAIDGTGRIFICDTSNSEIHILAQITINDWDLTTIYDKGSAVPPSPEQPVGCNIVGPDLYFGERPGSTDEHGIWVMRDAAVTPTSGPFNAPELLVSIPATSGDEMADIAFSPTAHVLIAIGNRILSAAPPDDDVFETLIDDLPGEATGLALNSVAEIFVAMADLGIIEVYNTTGESCGIYVDVSPLRPGGMQFDLADVLYFVAPRQSNGRNGDVFMAEPNGGPAHRQCDFPAPMVTATPLTDDPPDAQSGIALPPGSVSVELNFPDDDPLTAKLCSALFTLDPEFVRLNPDCVVTVTCRQMPLEEFESRTQDDFPNTVCMDIPGANGNCIEIVVEALGCLGGVTELEWIFFVVSDVFPEDCPGLLYSHTASLTQHDDFEQNILTAFDSVVPDLPNDPALRGRRTEIGSGLVGVTGAPNRAPVADAGADQTIACSGGETVTIDGSASFDYDPIDAGQLTFAWSGPVIPQGAEDDPMFDVFLGPGVYTYDLTVTDMGLYCDGGPLSSMDSVTITVTADTSPAVINGITPDPAVLWPPNHQMVPVSLSVDATDDCSAAVSCQIISVESSDPIGSPQDPDTGDGGLTYPDWDVTGPLTLDLRSERSEGGDSVDNARIYTITVECTDGVHAPVQGFTQVLVHSDQGN